MKIYRPAYKKVETEIRWKRLVRDGVVQARKGFKFKDDEMLVCPACNNKIEQGPVYLICFENVGNRMCHEKCVDEKDKDIETIQGHYCLGTRREGEHKAWDGTVRLKEYPSVVCSQCGPNDPTVDLPEMTVEEFEKFREFEEFKRECDEKDSVAQLDRAIDS